MKHSCTYSKNSITTKPLVQKQGTKSYIALSVLAFLIFCLMFSNAHSQNEALFINATGNVGIGKDSQGEKLEVNGNVKANGIIVPGFPTNALVPAGIIVMWSGSISAIPTGWTLCDGASSNIPDLRSRFIVGYDNRTTDPGGNYWDYNYNQLGYTGGELNKTLSYYNMPSHNHTGVTDNSGQHVHTWNGYREKCVCAGAADVFSRKSISTDPADNITNNDGNHSHKLLIDYAGNNLPFDGRPPFYTLAYIIKL